MKVSFLSADTKITKKYRLVKNSLQKESYPFLYEFDSTSYEIQNINEFQALITKHAALGDCLLKGELQRPLVKESRQGATDRDQKTQWICLDLDGVDGFQSVDLFLEAIEIQNVDYILQWSSSMGIENSSGFRCHVFMLLDTEMHPQLLKYWLQDLNLQILAPQLQLTSTGNSLRYPLDITTCQNDKLLYIAPPELGPGIMDPFAGNRISLVTKQYRTLRITRTIPSKDVIREAVSKKVSELREKEGLPKKKNVKYKYSGTTEYLANPDEATITGCKSERGFVYFNLNGGDSWAYYHPEDNPKFIHNFKGEPSYKTSELLPDYWAELQLDSAAYAPNNQGRIHFAVRDFRTSNYYNGWYDTRENDLRIAMAKSESQLRQFMAQHGRVLGEYIPDWDLIWDPHDPKVIDPSTRVLNTYRPSEYDKEFDPQLPAVTQIPPTIEKIISHVMGGEADLIDHFLNWLACIFQYRTSTGTAWVWHGIEGTGKGVLFHKVISPLLGPHNVVSKRMEELESEFTGFMENRFVAFVDEIETGKNLYYSKIMAKLKNLIVEPTISIRHMYSPAYMATNYANMIFSSNKPAPVEVSPNDRRFNVAPFQQSKIILSTHEVERLIPQELSSFYSYMMHYPADRDRARVPIITEHRARLINISRTAIDTVSDALAKGNLEFLWEHLSSSKAHAMHPVQSLKYMPFRELVIRLVQTQATQLTRDDLYTIMEWCVGNMPQSPNKFTALLKHHQIHLEQIWVDGRNVRGISVQWNCDANWLAQAQAEIANGDI